MKKIAILGSTGSIGTQTLEVLSLHKDKFKVTALVAHSNIELFEQQLVAWQPQFAALTGISNSTTNAKTKVFYGENAIDLVLKHAEFDYVVVALVGMMGLKYVLQCLTLGKRVLLANKEALVAGGALVLNAVEKASLQAKHLTHVEQDATYYSGLPLPSPLKRILPIDSEHSAIFQCLNATNHDIDTLFLTCSGGPFLHWDKQKMLNATVDEALKHPKWHMGKKISIDSATLFNKALEIIEAKWLFNVDEEKIKVLIHPQSIVHSMVGFKDKSVIAQLGVPSMKVPILYALSYPERLETGLDFPPFQTLEFLEPDNDKFEALSLARLCLREGGSRCAVLNASNEIAVAYFLDEKIKFGQITDTVKATLNALPNFSIHSFEDVEQADFKAREFAINYLNKRL